MQVLESKARSTKFWICYQILFSKKKERKKERKPVFLRSEKLDEICSLDFTEEYGGDLEWTESAKIMWPAAGVPGLWLTFCTRWKTNPEEKCPFWSVHAKLSHGFSRSLQSCFRARKKWMGGTLLSISVDSWVTKCLVTSLHSWNYAWGRNTRWSSNDFVIRQQA